MMDVQILTSRATATTVADALDRLLDREALDDNPTLDPSTFRTCDLFKATLRMGTEA